MTKTPVRLLDLFTYYKGEPHQRAAIAELEAAMPPSLLNRENAWFHTWSQAGKVPEGQGRPATYGNPLTVNYYQQLDSQTDQGRRMCFSSSCAMLLSFLRPGILKGPNGDDQYLARVRQFGDTTSPTAQVQALGSYEVRAEFTKRADWATIERQIDRGIPVPCGYLHRGPVTAPAGGGHWLCVVGYTAESLIVHDPLGEADLISGATLNGTARYAYYSRQNFGKRWMVEGPGTGWAIVADR